MPNLLKSTASEIESRIFTIRGLQVMLDRDLAELYQVEVKALNQAVKRNIGRFPPDFYFQLTKNEFDGLALKSQIVTSKGRDGIRKMPYAFTEQGVSTGYGMIVKMKQINICIITVLSIILYVVSHQNPTR
ncbi:MAG: ORF6N domain-containing protein [Chitinispirillales bacterium]|jgi:hypothetical protein|nr:ORF6N domain-containing protein [Chitinispirillales bacterium]